LVVLVWGFEVESLVRPLGVVGVDPGTQCEARVLDGLEVPGPCELFLEGLDEAFTESVLLGRIRSDVFLSESVVRDNSAVAT
jgi:hypothetical protein